MHAHASSSKMQGIPGEWRSQHVELSCNCWSPFLQSASAAAVSVDHYSKTPGLLSRCFPLMDLCSLTTAAAARRQAGTAQHGQRHGVQGRSGGGIKQIVKTRQHSCSVLSLVTEGERESEGIGC